MTDMISHPDSASIHAKARALGVSREELIELAVQALEIPDSKEAKELRALVDQVNARVPETLRIVDDCHRHVLRVFGEASSDPSRVAVSEA